MSSNTNGIGGTQNSYANLYGTYGSKAKSTKDDLGELKKATGGVNSTGGATIQEMWDRAHSATEALRNLVANMLGAGANKTGGGYGQGYWAVRANPDSYDLKVDPELRAEAERMIADDGYFGVEQTTNRIMDFAKALAGGNVTDKTIEQLREGARKGFDAAAKLFGGMDKMPEISRKTYDAVMKAFDDWKASLTSAASAESEE